MGVDLTSICGRRGDAVVGVDGVDRPSQRVARCAAYGEAPEPSVGDEEGDGETPAEEEAACAAHEPGVVQYPTSVAWATVLLLREEREELFARERGEGGTGQGRDDDGGNEFVHRLSVSFPRHFGNFGVG